MLNTNGNRKPKTFMVKTNITRENTYDLRDFLSNGTSANVHDKKYSNILTKKEALSIISEKERKNGEVFSMVSSSGKNFNVSIYIIEKKAIRNIVRHSGVDSDEVEINPNHYFTDESVVNKKAKMYVLNGKVIVIQHPDEISIFESENKDALFVLEVEVKSVIKSLVTVEFEVDYRSSANHSAKLDADTESEFIHIKPSSSKSSIKVKVYNVKKESYSEKSFTVSEDISGLIDGIYKVKDDGVVKKLAIETEKFTGDKKYYLFKSEDTPVKDKDVIKLA